MAIVAINPAGAQTVPYQRAFSQSKAVVEKQIRTLQSSNSGHLPVLDGFVIVSDHPLDGFRRGYYQCATQVTSSPSGGSIVRVNATITAWYTDPTSKKSGYQVLPSNGRLESDFLDQLQESFGSIVASSTTTATKTASSAPAANSQPAVRTQSNPAPILAAPPVGSKSPVVGSKIPGSPFNLGDPLAPSNMPSLAKQKAMLDRHSEGESTEVASLEEILHNQVHPGNLVAVRIKDTPVLASPSEDSKVLFLAAAEDEFEILDVNSSWVHIRISGLSRGWIRRSSLEMLIVDPDDQPAEVPAQASQPTPVETQPFHVENEQVTSFPGSWPQLRGKMVKIISLQKAVDNNNTASPEAKLAFAKSLLAREYDDLAKTSASIDGVVVIFDSDDGGMLSATMPVLRQWRAESLSDEAFWRRCYFDPPEAFGIAANP